MQGEGQDMRDYIEQRAMEIALYIIEKKGTVRKAAAVYKISKSTVHKDMRERLPKINAALAKEVMVVLELNKAERHIRGGQATCLKYQEKAQRKRFGKNCAEKS